MSDVSPEFYWLALALVTVLSASRLTRLATFDLFPPIMWVRNKYLDFTESHAPLWASLAFCGYCSSFWLTGLVVLWAYAVGVLNNQPAWGGDGDLSQPLWWAVNGTLAASYLAAVFMRYDGDTSQTDADSDTEKAV